MAQPMKTGRDDLEIQVQLRADGGEDAWLFLAGCFVLEALVWGSENKCIEHCRWYAFLDTKADNENCFLWSSGVIQK